MDIKWIGHKPINKKELIHELRKKEIINPYGQFNYHLLEQEYSKNKARDIWRKISQKDIYETYTLQELYTIAKAIHQDIGISLLKKNTYKEDARDLMDVIEVIRRKECRKQWRNNK